MSGGRRTADGEKASCLFNCSLLQPHRAIFAPCPPSAARRPPLTAS